MAVIIIGASRCSLCEEVLGSEDDLYSVSHFLTPLHPLWRYSDSGMHWDCFEKWEHREEFVNELIPVVTDPKRGWGWERAFAGDACTVLMNVVAVGTTHELYVRDNPKIVLWLHRAGTQYFTSLNDWDEWIAALRRCKFELLQSSWSDAQRELQGLSSDALIRSVDVESVLQAVRQKADRDLARQRARAERRTLDVSVHNGQLHNLLLDEPPCPHCGADFHSLKYYDNRERNRRRSCVICQSCARSSRVEEFEGISLFDRPRTFVNQVTAPRT